MGVRKTNRRKLVIDDRLFVWYAAEDSDGPGLILHVISDDKRFIVRYHVAQSGTSFLIVLGPEFGGVTNTGGCWRRFECPKWEDGDAITPSCVRRLIDWCLLPNKEVVEVDWRGIRLGHEVPSDRG
jgi:hypothetical protein